MLKLKVDSIDDIDEKLRDLYEKSDDGFLLKVDGLEDTGALKRAKDREKENARLAKERADKLEQDLNELRENINDGKHKGAKTKGDIEALDKSWQEKYDKLASEKDAQIEGLRGNITHMTVDNVAMSLASELAVEGSSKVLLPHIKARLASEERDGKWGTSVLDSDGKPSAASLDDLKKEFASDPAFAHVVSGSKASGSGAAPGSKGGGAAPQTGKVGGTREERLAYFQARLDQAG